MIPGFERVIKKYQNRIAEWHSPCSCLTSFYFNNCLEDNCFRNIHLKTLKRRTMKKTKLALVALAISAVILFSFDAIPASTIKGTVTPGETKAIKA